MNSEKKFNGMPNWNPNLDYVAEVKKGDKTYMYRNPKEDKETGELTDKNQDFGDGEIVLFGTSNWDWKKGTVQRVGIDVDTDNHGLDEETFKVV